jgi:6-phospho-beta-glucosidase
VVNLANNGTLPFLDDDHVIEVTALVDSSGAQPVRMAPVEPVFAGLIAHVAAYERLALEAAMKGGRDRVFDALLAHPLVGQIELAEQLTDRLLAQNHQFLAWAR